MKSHYRWIVLALLSCASALADLSQTTTVATNFTLNLDTGVTAASAGRVTGNPDILWSGTSLSPVGTATLVNVGAIGQNGFRRPASDHNFVLSRLLDHPDSCRNSGRKRRISSTYECASLFQGPRHRVQRRLHHTQVHDLWRSRRFQRGSDDCGDSE
jgi:hypothetical protein